MNDLFGIVLQFVGGFFIGVLMQLMWLPLRSVVEESFRKPKLSHFPGTILLLGLFGIPLVHFAEMLIESWPLLLGASSSCAWWLKRSSDESAQ